MKTILKFFTYTFLLCCFTQAKATHLMGGEITWTCLGGDSFLVNTTIYRDCNGIPLDNQDITILDCNYTSITVSGGSGKKIYARDITPVCKKQCTRCAASPNGSNLSCTFAYGIEVFIFQQKVILPVKTKRKCCQYYFVWDNCCRNSAITTGAADESFHIESMVDACLSRCDNSPYFSGLPINIIKSGICTTLNFSALDNDIDTLGNRDSMVYSITKPIQSRSGKSLSYVTWNSPYTYDKPFYFDSFPNTTWNPATCVGYRLDSLTGIMQFMPTKVQETVLSVRVLEYRKDTLGRQILIGYIVRDIQLIILANDGNHPPSLSGIDSTKSVDTVIKAGQNICFNVFANDPDSSDTATISCASFLLNRGASFKCDTILNSAKAKFCWHSTAADANVLPYYIVFAAYDNHCPMRAYNYEIYRIWVLPANVDSIIVNTTCGDASFNVLSAPRTAKTYQWSGDDSLYSAKSKFSHHYKKPGLYHYKVIVTDSLGRGRSDTGSVYIKSVNSTLVPTLSLSGGDTLTASPSSPKYTWYKDSIRLSDTLKSIVINKAGRYTVQLIDSNGCLSQLSNTIVITGISDNHATNFLRIYPNPTTGIFSIEAPGINSGQISIISLTGQELIHTIINTKAELDLHLLPKGMYLLKLQSLEGVRMERVVLQ